MMRINKTDNVLSLYNKNNTVKKNENKRRKEDGIELSKEAKDYQFAMKKVKDMPDVRRSRVDEIKAQVQAGTYKIDSEKIADKILRNVEMHKKYNNW